VYRNFTKVQLICDGAIIPALADQLVDGAEDPNFSQWQRTTASLHCGESDFVSLRCLLRRSDLGNTVAVRRFRPNARSSNCRGGNTNNSYSSVLSG
jgi:hypothetical protein